MNPAQQARVEFRLRCKEDAHEPVVRFDGAFLGREGSPDEYLFSVDTRNVCLHPTVSCEVSKRDFWRIFAGLNTLKCIVYRFLFCKRS